MIRTRILIGIAIIGYSGGKQNWLLLTLWPKLTFLPKKAKTLTTKVTMWERKTLTNLDFLFYNIDVGCRIGWN